VALLFFVGFAGFATNRLERLVVEVTFLGLASLY
jgi:hypothetical protein